MLAGGVIFGGKTGETEKLYRMLAAHLEWKDQSLPRQTRCKLTDLPRQPASLSTAAPVSRLQPQLRSLPSDLYNPPKTKEQVLSEKHHRKARAAELRANLVNTKDLYYQ